MRAVGQCRPHPGRWRRGGHRRRRQGRRVYASLATAVDRLRTERAADPVRALGQLYPALGQDWQGLATADPTTLRQKLPGLIGQTADLMDKTGMPPGQRQYLPGAMVSQAVAVFGDTARPPVERVAPLRDAVAAARDPTRQQAIFEQHVDAGLPRLLAPAMTAYTRGDLDSAGRLLTAAIGDTPQKHDDDAAPVGATPSSPVALQGEQAPPTPPPLPNGGDIDLGPSVAASLARLDTADGVDFDNHPLTAQLRARLIRQNYQANGGDYAAAEVLARHDLRLPAGTQYAGALPNSLSDTPVDGGSVVTNPPGPKIDSVSGKNIIRGPDATPPNPANENNPGRPAPGFKTPSKPTRLKPGRGLVGTIGGLIVDDLYPPARDESPPYEGTSIPQSYSIDYGPFGKTIVPREITGMIKDYRTQIQPALNEAIKDEFADRYLKSLNSAIQDARSKSSSDERNGSKRLYYTGEAWDGPRFDISFSPVKEPNGEVTVAAVRVAARKAPWASKFFGDQDHGPGPWRGTPAPESKPEAPPPKQAARKALEAAGLGGYKFGTIAQPQPPGTTPGDSPQTQLTGSDSPEQPAALPQSHGIDDPYDEADYQAGLKAGLTDQAALAMAKGNYRKKATAAENLDKNKTETHDTTDTTDTNIPVFKVPPKIQDTDLGDVLGTGSEKRTYVYTPDPTKAVAVRLPDPSVTPMQQAMHVEEEINALRYLRREGFPAVEPFGQTSVNGQRAIMLEYVNGKSSKDILDGPYMKLDPEALKITNENTIKDLEMIRSMLSQKNIAVDDLQFIIDTNGRVKINDPMSIEPSHGIDSENAALLDNLIRIVRKKSSGVR